MSKNKNTQKKKKILFVEQNQDGTIGGSHYCLLYLVMLLDKKRFEPIVMFYEENSLISEFEKTGVRVIIFKRPNGENFSLQHNFAKLFSPLLIIMQKSYNFFRICLMPTLRFIRFIKSSKIDIIHLNNAITAGAPWIVAARLTGRRCLTFQRGYHYSLSRLEKFFGNKFDGVYCVSNIIRDNLLENGIDNKRCYTLYDGIDPDRLKKEVKRSPSEVRKEFNVAEFDEYLIGMVGNFMTWKGQDVLVQAVSLLKNKYPGIKCLLIGSEGTDEINLSYLNNIKRMIEENNLHDNVFITGYRTDVADLLNSLDVQVHPPTLPDPFPHVILEGMTLGKPIIAANHGGAIESLEDGVSGLLFEHGNPEILCQKITSLLSDGELRKQIGENARKRVAEKFHIRLNVHNVENVYDRFFA